MPETKMTRDELLVSAHELKPDDFLVVRVPADEPETAHQLAEFLEDRLRSAPIHWVVLVGDIEIDVRVYRPAKET